MSDSTQGKLQGIKGALWRWSVWLVPVLAGVSIAAAWMTLAGADRIIRPLLHARPLMLLLAAFLTLSALAVRFLRWQYLLRNAGVRLPIRSSLGAYLGGLPGIVTPAYVGEVLRCVLIRRRFGTPLAQTVPVLVLERLFDVLALALITLVLARNGTSLLFAGGFALVGLALIAAVWNIALRASPASLEGAREKTPSVFGKSLGLSLLSWSLAALIIPTCVFALGLDLPIFAGAHVFAQSTLFGGATLSPAGLGTTGSFEIYALKATMDQVTAIQIVTLSRLCSVGLALALGLVMLWRELATKSAPAIAAPGHFDEIAHEHGAQFSEHVWNGLMDRKIQYMVDALPPPATGLRGIDLGCGLGLQTAEMRRRGYDVTGMDASPRLLDEARKRSPGTPFIAGNALDLPFDDNSLDFVFTIGVLHHLPGEDAQARALAEINRVLKPGGKLLVHESNPRNPIFNFYMSYVFPLLKSIDDGTEWFIDPRTLQARCKMTPSGVRYFTFLPDFTPRFALAAGGRLERWLEARSSRAFSAHYMAVFSKA